MANDLNNGEQPDSGSGDSANSLLPMLISGLVLIVVGMIAVAAFV